MSSQGIDRFNGGSFGRIINIGQKEKEEDDENGLKEMKRRGRINTFE